MKRVNFAGTILAFLVLLLIGITNSNTVFVTEAQAVKIRPMDDLMANKVIGIAIDPEILHVKKNGIVIWMNGLPQREVQVVFQEKKACYDVPENPALLNSNIETGCYVGSFVPYAETSSLKFIQAGTFHYVVRSTDHDFLEEGTIEVE
jgi:hypothetical protein